MSEIEDKAREYCEKNIPSQPDMHLTISTAFEAGWQAAMNSGLIKNQRKRTKEFYKAVQSLRNAQIFYEEKTEDGARFKLKALMEYQVDSELGRINEALRAKGEEEL